MFGETRRYLKSVESRPGIMYGSFKVHIKCVDGSLLLGPVLSTLKTPTYKFTKFLVPILEPLPTNKCRIYQYQFISMHLQQ